MGVKLNRTQKRVNVILWVFIFVLGSYIIIRGISLISDSQINLRRSVILEKIATTIDQYALETYMPSLSYPLQQQEDSDSLIDYIAEKVFEAVPIYAYLKNTLDYTTEIENSSTTDRIVYTVEGMEVETPEVVHNDTTAYLEAETTEGTEVVQENVVADTAGESTVDVAAAETTGEASEAISGSTGFAKTASISMEKLADFDYLLQSYYIVDAMTTITSEELNAQSMMVKDLSIDVDSSVPQILIYHTHSQEDFIDSVEGDPSTTIVGVGEYLATILRETYGYNVIHDTSVYDLVDGVLDRDYAYTLSGAAAAQILEENPTIQVVIDLHRDGTNDKVVTEYNGKSTARFMFFNGLSKSSRNGPIDYLANPNIQDNLAFSFQMQIKAAEYFPGVSRGIYLRSLRYNMHLAPRMLLIESGSQLNTVEEEMNAMVLIAELLDQVLTGR